MTGNRVCRTDRIGAPAAMAVLVLFCVPPAHAQMSSAESGVMDPPNVHEKGLNALSVTWTEVVDLDPPVTGYDLQYRRSGDERWINGPQDQTGASAEIGNLSKDTHYQVRVRPDIPGSEVEWSKQGGGATALWTATLGVGSLGGTRDTGGYWGYQRRQSSNWSNIFGSLTPHVLTYDEVEYDIFILSWYRGNRGGAGGMHTSALDFYMIRNTFPSHWMLRVDTSRFAFDDAERTTFEDYDDYGLVEKYYWIDPDIEFVLGGEYDIAISRSLTVDDAVSEVPLTAEFKNFPAAHDGSTMFTIELHFSEEVRASYLWFTDSVFSLTGGSVKVARRDSPPSNRVWSIDVEPSGDGDVIITLPAKTDCSETGVMCTTDGRSLAQPVQLTVSHRDSLEPPDISGPSSFTVLEGDTAVATLTATDADTDSADLQWSIPAGAAGGADGGRFTLTGAGALSFAQAKDFEAPDDADADGSYQVAVQVSDGVHTDTAALTVRLANRNEAPTADAGSDQAAIEPGATVTLAGTGSDPDAGDTLAYRWTQTGGETVALSGADAATATFTAPARLRADGTLTFSLKVTDAGNLHHTDTVSVMVQGQAWPVATVAAPVSLAIEGEAASFEVRLDKPAPWPVSVLVAVSESGGMLTGTLPTAVDFAAGERIEAVTLATADDQVMEANSRVTVVLGDGDDYDLGTSVTADMTIADNDTPAPAIAQPEVNEHGLESLEVTWPDMASYDATVFAYDLQYREDGDPGWTDGPQNETGTRAYIDDLSKDTDYQVRVRTVNGAGRGEWSEPGHGVTALWTATLGAGWLRPGTTHYLGYQRRGGLNTFGSLTPHVITYDEVEYDIFILSWFRGWEGFPYRLDFYVIQQKMPSHWMLRVDTSRFAFGDAERTTFEDYDAYGRAEKYYWLDPDIDLAFGGKYDVAISRSLTVDDAVSEVPLTAEFKNFPAAHDGSTMFTIELHFSEEVRASYLWFTDSVFSLTGGSVKVARRDSPPSNRVWSIDVEPSGDGDVIITLPAKTDCSETGGDVHDRWAVAGATGSTDRQPSGFAGAAGHFRSVEFHGAGGRHGGGDAHGHGRRHRLCRPAMVDPRRRRRGRGRRAVHADRRRRAVLCPSQGLRGARRRRCRRQLSGCRSGERRRPHRHGGPDGQAGEPERGAHGRRRVRSGGH